MKIDRPWKTLGAMERQRGLGLPTAIFVITVMALLAVLVNQLVESGAESTGEEVLLARAFYAAQSGLDIAMNEIFPPAGSAEAPLCVPESPCGGSLDYDFTVAGLNGCSAQVDYSRIQTDLSGDGVDEDFYTLFSTGTCGGVSRRLQIRAR